MKKIRSKQDTTSAKNPTYRELSIPPEAKYSPGSTEVLSVWVVNGGLIVHMHTVWDNPAKWGQLFADMANNVAEMITEDSGQDQNTFLREMEGAFYRSCSQENNTNKD